MNSSRLVLGFLIVSLVVSGVVSVKAEKPGVPQVPVKHRGLIDIQRDGFGRFVITTMDSAATVKSNTTVETYLATVEQARSGNVEKALALARKAVEQPLDFSAVIPDENSTCPIETWHTATTEVAQQIAVVMHSGLCDLLASGKIKDSQQADNLTEVCLKMPIHLGEADPPRLLFLINAQLMMQKAGQCCAKSLLDRGLVDRAVEEEARARRARDKSLSQKPLLLQLSRSQEDIITIGHKVGVGEAAFCGIVKGIDDVEEPIVSQLRSAWLRAVRETR